MMSREERFNLRLHFPNIRSTLYPNFKWCLNVRIVWFAVCTLCSDTLKSKTSCLPAYFRVDTEFYWFTKRMTQDDHFLPTLDYVHLIKYILGRIISFPFLSELFTNCCKSHFLIKLIVGIFKWFPVRWVASFILQL